MDILAEFDDQVIYEPRQVFKACAAIHGQAVLDKMYMHSDDEHTHYFKDIVTRQYYKYELPE